MLLYYEITNENLDIAINIQNTIFPDYSAKVNYIEAIKKITNNKYYLLSDGREYVGITGIYSYIIDPESAWLGWFGILEEYRNKGYGRQALLIYEKMAMEKGYRYARLYTDKYDNDMALHFYRSNDYIFEDYLNEEDSASLRFPILIGSKALDGSKVEPWNNRNIELTEQIKKQI